MRREAEVCRVGSAATALVLPLLVFLTVFARDAAAQKPVVTETKPIEITARQIAGFDRENLDRQTFGRLRWRGGLVLSSSSNEFGGLSGLVLDDDGRRLLAVSDTGAWLTAELTYEGTRPSGLRRAWIGPLLALNGSRLTRSRDRDAEAVTLSEGSLDDGLVLIAFEGNHRIGRFRMTEAGPSAPLHYVDRPPDYRRLGSNQGFESVSVLRAGRFKGSIIAFSERLPDERGHHTGWIWVDGKPRKLHLVDISGFDITDAAALDDGGLLVLERRFRWTEGVKMRLRLLSPDEIAPGAVMRGEVLFEGDMAYDIDNMEGVAVHRGPHGETVVTLLSDNNFNPLLQRTLLLQFTLKENGED